MDILGAYELSDLTCDAVSESDKEAKDGINYYLVLFMFLILFTIISFNLLYTLIYLLIDFTAA